MKTTLGIFAAAALVGGIVASASLANAAWTQTQASACTGAASNPTSSGASGFGWTNGSTTADATVYCPVMESSTVPKTPLSNAKVYYFDNTTSSQLTFQACATLVGGGTSCGNPTYSGVSPVGYNYQSLDRTSWTNHPTDFAYIYAIIPRLPAAGVQPSAFLGYYITT